MKKLLLISLIAVLAGPLYGQLTSPRPSPDAVNVVPAGSIAPSLQPTPPTTYSGDAANPALHASIVLTPAQIRALNTTPVSVVPAGGAGKLIVLAGPVSVKYTYGTAVYSSGGALVLQYHTGTTAATGTLAATAITASTDTGNAILPVATAITTAALENNALEVTCGTADFGGSTATGTIQIDVYYRVL